METSLPHLSETAFPSHVELPQAVRTVIDRLAGAGFHTVLVGGCVRDLILRRAVTDYDVATAAPPDTVLNLFRRAIPTGIAHGTITVVEDGQTVEVTTFRGEGEYVDGRRPTSVRYLTDVTEDLRRRDFTINAMAYDPRAGEWIDPHGGLDDLRRRCIRAVGDPRERFSEDGLRIMRAVRFASTLGFHLERGTARAIPSAVETWRKVARERIRDEWSKLLFRSHRPSHGMELLSRYGLARDLFPDHCENETWQHVLRTIDRLAVDDGCRLAALVPLGGTHPDQWLTEARWARQQVRHAVDTWRGARLLMEGPPTSDAEFRRWLATTGRDCACDALRLASAWVPRRTRQWRAIRQQMRSQWDSPVSLAEMTVNGADLQRQLGIPPGRALGTLLGRLLDRVIEDPASNTPEILLSLVRSWNTEAASATL